MPLILPCDSGGLIGDEPIRGPEGVGAGAPATTDVFTAEQRSAVMRKVPGKDTSAEMKVRRLLTGLGLRYRLHRKDLPGSPDIAMPGKKVAIFVHGCFWHGHDCKRGARAPKANADYWSRKIARNKARDAASTPALQAMGWRPLVIWECELKDAQAVSQRLSAELHAAASARSS